MEGNFHVGAKNEYSVSSEFIFLILLLQRLYVSMCRPLNVPL
jgi:hypothetical protein